MDQETIVAPATAPGRSGVAIIRMSGPLAFNIGSRLCGELSEPMFLKPCSIKNNKSEFESEKFDLVLSIEVMEHVSDLISYLPQGFHGNFVSDEGDAVVLVARVPDAQRFDPDINDMPRGLRHTDWTREPILESEHDARKRIYMATPALAGTNAFKGEMITYPPGTAAPEHHHVGAEHFQYIISGRVTALLNGDRQELEAGDVLYNYEHELHTFINESDAEAVFVEFFVPGPCETVWSPGANVCAWLPTGIDSEGRKPAREIAYHIHGQDDGL